jgi:MFS family permease
MKKSMRTFYVIWFGQLISTLGSGLTGFALGVWLYQETESVTLFAFNILMLTVPQLIVTPLAGALADRMDRRILMIVSDTGVGLTTLTIWLLFATGQLEIWHIYVTSAVASAFGAFQWPAYSAAITMMVPKDQLGRAGGMTQIGQAISQLFSPAIAGVLFVTIGVEGIIFMDFVTFVVAVGTLLFVRIPAPTVTDEGKASRGSIWQEMAFGWTYITSRSGLLGLLMYFALVNFSMGLANPLFQPYLLNLTTPDRMGVVVSLAGIGMLVGTIIMSAWGGPKKRVAGLLAFGALAGVAFIVFGWTSSLVVITIGGFIFFFALPILNALSQAVWQSKVAADVQGRVFAVRRLIAQALQPVGVLLAGPAVDRVFGPLMAEDGPLAGSVGRVIGTGPGRDIGLLIIVVGVIFILGAAAVYANPRVRNVEQELPDAVVEPEAEDVQEPADAAAASP